MSDTDNEIVTRLRRLAQGSLPVKAQVALWEAADEIERLRGMLDVQNEQVQHYVAERDLARREVCRWRARSRARSAKWIAEALRWDCFKDDDANYRGILGNSNPPNEMGQDGFKETP